MEDRSEHDSKDTHTCHCTGHCAECGGCSCGNGVHTADGKVVCEKCVRAHEDPDVKVARIRTAAADRGFKLGL